MTLLIILCTAHNKQPNSHYDAEPRFCEQGGSSVFYIKYAEETPDGRVGETSSKRVGGGWRLPSWVSPQHNKTKLNDDRVGQHSGPRRGVAH